MSDFKKSLTVVRGPAWPRGFKVRTQPSEKPYDLQVIAYEEHVSSARGHTITLTLMADCVEFVDGQ